MKKKQWKYTIIMGILCFMCLMSGCGKRSAESLEKELSYRELGILRLNQGEYEEAVKVFQMALGYSLAVIEDLERDICYYKAIAQYKSGDVEGALETYTALVEYDKKNSSALYLRGTLYLQHTDIENALKDYKEALAVDANNGTLYNKIAENLRNAGYNAEAGEILNNALQVKGDEPWNYREKGYSYYLLEQYDSARTFLDKAINEGDSEAIFYLAKLLETKGELEQANQLYESYMGDNSRDTDTLNTLGCAKMAEGNYEQALSFFQTALTHENITNEQELRRNEIAALEYMLDFATAREKLKAYLEDYPADEIAVREYEFLKSR